MLLTIFISGCVHEKNARYKEGEMFNLFEDPKAICCEGLTKVVGSFPENQQCIAPTCPCFVCIKCGDREYGKDENLCNCPEDCHKK